MSSFREDVPPWSFFIPVTLAVIVGVLAADAIRFAIGTVFDGGEGSAQTDAGAAAEARAKAAADAVAEAERARAAPALEPAPASTPRIDPAPSAADAVDSSALPEEQEAAAAEEASRSDGALELPDSMSARRDGEPAACVNGTVANRVAGGWEQALEGDAPIPCVTADR